jgi:hypothetical protein
MKNKIIAIIAVLLFSIYASASDSHCDSLKSKEMLLNQNIKKDAIILMVTGFISIVPIIYLTGPDSRIGYKQAAVLGVAVGIPVGVLSVTSVDGIKKLIFRIKNRNKCKENSNE